MISNSWQLHLYHLKRAMFEYHHPFLYLKNKYLFAPTIKGGKPPIQTPINFPTLSVHMLICHRDLIIALWALISFYQIAKISGHLYFHDDGSLNTNDKMLLQIFFPSAIIIPPHQLLKKYLTLLQPYPYILKFSHYYRRFIFIKKLIDPYFISSCPNRLVIDSDLLWFKQPTEIIDAINHNCPKSYMLQSNLNTFISFKDGTSQPNCLSDFNAGVILYHRKNLDLNKLNAYFSKLNPSNQENATFIEQTGYAVSLKHLTKLPTQSYTLNGMVKDHVIMRHYTTPKRPWFYIEGIPIISSRIKQTHL